MAYLVKDILEKSLAELNADTSESREVISQFLLDNAWFGIKVDMTNLSISESDAQLLTDKIKAFLSGPVGLTGLQPIFKQKFPMTFELFQDFSKEKKLSRSSRFYLQDFLAYDLTKDLFLYSDSEIEWLVQEATEVLSKSYGEELNNFIRWMMTKGITHYRKSFEMTARYTLEDKNGAYELDDYLELMYYLFNDSYIKKQDMLYQAASSKNYADTWLYLSLHFICALRTTDLERLGHPELPREPKGVLEAVQNGTWSSSEARRTLLSITTRLTFLNVRPNKTKRASNISQLKFHVPESCQDLIGTLLAICESHYQLGENTDSEEPLLLSVKSMITNGFASTSTWVMRFALSSLSGTSVVDQPTSLTYKLLTC